MNKHRMVSTAFWDDRYIMKLEPPEKLLFMYLLTNPLTTICGIYQIELTRMAFDTGISEEILEGMLQRFEVDGKCLFRGGWIAMKNWIKHQNPSGKVLKGIQIQLKGVPKALLKYVNSNHSPIPYGYGIDTPSHLNLNSNLKAKSNTVSASTPLQLPKRKPALSVQFNFSTRLWENIPDEKVKEWSEAFPACKVERELTKMAEWLEANPTKRKSNYARFIFNWLTKSQDRGGTK